MHNDTSAVLTPEAPICRFCQQRIPRNVNDSASTWRRRKYCSLDHRRQWEQRQATAEAPELNDDQKARLCDIRELLGLDNVYGFRPETPANVAARLGTTTTNLSRWLYRIGERELAAKFNPDSVARRRRRQRARVQREDAA